MAKYNNYFPHDANLRNTSPILMLRMKLGLEGYGAYCMILERLRSENDYTGVRDYDMMAFDLRCDRELVRAVVEDFGLFDLSEDGESVISNSLTEWMKPLDSAQDAKKAAAEKRWSGKKKECSADAEHMQSKCSAYAEDDAAHMQTERENDAEQCYKRKENKINKRKINKEKEVAVRASRACVGDPPPSSATDEDFDFSLADAVVGLKNDSDWIESVSAVADIDASLLPGMLDQFAVHAKSRGKCYPDIGEAMAHFMNWLPTKSGKEAMARVRKALGARRQDPLPSDGAPDPSTPSVKPDEIIRRWGYDPAKVSLVQVMNPAWRAKNPPDKSPLP